MDANDVSAGPDFQANNVALFRQRSAVVVAVEAAASQTERRRKERELERINTEIVELNKGLAVGYARRFFIAGVSRDTRDDILSGAMHGLVEAINSYDVTVGTRFAGWAYNPIKRSVLDALRASEHPHLSQSDFEARAAIKKARAALVTRSGVEPALDEIAALAGATTDQVERVLRGGPLSLDEPAFEDGGPSRADQIADRGTDLESELYAARSKALGRMVRDGTVTSAEFAVFIRRGGLEGSPPDRYFEIADDMGMNREWVRRQHASILKKLNELELFNQDLRPGEWDNEDE